MNGIRLTFRALFSLFRGIEPLMKRSHSFSIVYYISTENNWQFKISGNSSAYLFLEREPFWRSLPGTLDLSLLLSVVATEIKSRVKLSVLMNIVQGSLIYITIKWFSNKVEKVISRFLWSCHTKPIQLNKIRAGSFVYASQGVTKWPHTLLSLRTERQLGTHLFRYWVPRDVSKRHIRPT